MKWSKSKLKKDLNVPQRCLLLVDNEVIGITYTTLIFDSSGTIYNQNPITFNVIKNVTGTVSLVILNSVVNVHPSYMELEMGGTVNLPVGQLTIKTNGALKDEVPEVSQDAYSIDQNCIY